MPWIKREPIDPSGNRSKRGRETSPAKGSKAGNEPDPSEKSFFEESKTRFSSVVESNGRSDPGPGKFRDITLKFRTAVALGLGTAFTMFWVFVLGILVGRGALFEYPAGQTLEDLLGKKMREKAAPAVEVTKPGQDQAREADDIDTKLTFYRALKQNTPQPERGLPAPQPSEAPRLPKVPDPPNPEEKTAPQAQKQRTDDSARNPKPQDTLVTSGVKTVSEKESEAPAPKRRAGENFTVQVSAASTADEAERAVQRLKARGYDAYYYQVELNNRKYFRVRVGRYATREEARNTLGRLAAEGRENLFISILTD